MTKKVLFYHDEFPCGGAEKVTIDIADYVSSFNYEIYVITRVAHLNIPSNLKVFELPSKKNLNNTENFNFIVNLIQTLDIAIFVLPIHLNLSLLEWIKTKTNCKLIFSLHSTPFWEVISQLYTKKKKAKGNILKTLEWFLLTYPKTKWLRKYDRTIQNDHLRIYNIVDAYTVLCDKYRDSLQEKLQLPKQLNKFHVIQNSQKVISNVNLKKKQQVLYVGRLNYDDKRVDRLLHIWKLIYHRVPDWELVIVGDGTEKQELQQMTIKMKLQNVRFAGYQIDPSPFYRDASILCLTSNFEGWGIVLTEAQANGVIPFAFNCAAGIEEIIGTSERYGFLITPYNLKEYGQKLLNLMNNPNKMNMMHRLVLQKAKEYSSEAVGKKWMSLFDSLNDSASKAL